MIGTKLQIWHFRAEGFHSALLDVDQDGICIN